jgi:hypothetical protein
MPLIAFERSPRAQTTRADSVTDAAICSISAEALWTILMPSVESALEVSEMSAVSLALLLTWFMFSVSSLIAPAVARAASRCWLEPAATRLASPSSCLDALTTSTELNNTLPTIVAKLPIRRLKSSATAAISSFP